MSGSQQLPKTTAFVGPVPFICECPSNGCTQIVRLTMGEYEDIHVVRTPPTTRGSFFCHQVVRFITRDSRAHMEIARGLRRLAHVLAGVIAITAVWIPAAAAASPPKTPQNRGVQRLWSEFPLGLPRRAAGVPTRVKTPTKITTITPRAAVNGRQGGRLPRVKPGPRGDQASKPRHLTAFTLWAIGAAAAAFALAVFIRSNQKGARMPDFLRPFTRRDDEDGDETPEPEPQWRSVGQGIYQPPTVDDTALTHDSGDAMPAPLTQSATPPPLAEESATPDLGHFGEHIATVLAAAEAAAQKVRADAEREANEARVEAGRVADEIRAEASQEAQAERASARRAVEEAAASGEGARSDADRYAAARRDEADAQATKLIVDAERRAASLADTADERHRALLENIATSENRLRELARSLRGVAASIDSAIEGSEHGEPEESTDSLEGLFQPNARDNSRADPSIVDGSQRAMG